MALADDSRPARRGFLGRLTASVLAMGALPSALVAADRAAPPPFAVDERWMDALTGKYRQFWDCRVINDGGVLGAVRNFMNAYRDAYEVPDADMNAIAGFHGTAAALAFNDAAWRRFRFGQSTETLDPVTRMPALRNPALSSPALAPDALLPALQQRGATFLLCNNSLRRITATLAGDGLGTALGLRAELLGTYLLPGVIVVPAMVVTANRLQGRGVSYVAG